MINRLSKEEQKKLYAFFETGCKDISIEPEFWIHGSDESVSYCMSCAWKEMKRLEKENPDGGCFIDGGDANTEGDTIPYCGCGQLLENSLLDSGCNDEVDYFLKDEFDIESEYDCYSMMCVIDSMDWESWNNNKEDDAFYNDLHNLCRLILNDINAKENEKRCKIEQ